MRNVAVFTAGLIAVSGLLLAQQAPPTTIPRLVRISNTFHAADAQPAASVEGVTLSIYRDEREGAPLWQETQNVSVDSEGRYSVLLGATLNEGLPLELFTSGEPRWLGVRFNRPGEVEQARTLLTTVPYALRASDAETLGGLPASAFLRDPSVSSSSPASTAAASANLAPNAPKPRVSLGTAGYLGVFTDATDLAAASLYQYGMRIGLNTTLPYDYMHVVFNDPTGTFAGYAVQNLNAGGFSGMLFYDQSGALAQFQGFGNTTHEYRVNNLASNGTMNFMLANSSKLYVANSGYVGIGTAAPGWRLDVAGDINMNGNLLSQGSPVLQLSQSAVDNLGVGPGTSGVNAACCNTGVGVAALSANISSCCNTALGAEALRFNTGQLNTAVGAATLQANTSGANNTGIGGNALLNNVTGSSNTAVGQDALSNSAGSGNIAVGAQAGVAVISGSNNIHIGSQGTSGDNGTIRIGTAITQTSLFAAGVYGVTTGNNDAVSVVIDSNGQLGTISSSRRYKEDIRDMRDLSRGLMQLRPVTFRYQRPFADGSKPLQYGLIAEEVAEVYPDLVARSADGEIETVKYQVLDAMLLNEVQRLEKEVQDLRTQLERVAPRNP